jgi:NNP family nitrate/nitrite transporter-like MFS transporter
MLFDPAVRPLRVFVLCLAGAAQSLVFINHAPLLPLIMPALDLSPARAGLLSTAMFLGGGLLAVPMGRLADRLGPKRLMSVSMAVLGVSTVALAFAHDLTTMLLIRLASGLGVTAMFIAGGQYIAALWTGRSRALVQGLYGAANQFGIGMAVFALPWAGQWLGWRGALAICAVPLAAAVTLWEATAPAVPPPVHVRGPAPVLDDARVWRLGLANAASFGLTVVVGTWIAVYFVTEFRLSLPAAGALGSLSVVVGVFTRPLGGFLIAHGYVRDRALLCWTLGLSTVGLLLMAVPGRPLILASAAVALVGLTATMSFAGILSVASRERPDAIGEALGLISAVSTLTVVIGAPLAGALLTASGSFSVPFAVLALLPAGALLSLVTTGRTPA